MAIDLGPIRKRFVERLPERIAPIVAGLAEPGPTATREIRDALHKLTGTAATIGFTTVSEAARTAELSAERCLDGPLDEAATAAVQAALAAVHRAAADFT